MARPKGSQAMESEYECAACGELFLARRDDATTCGAACRKKLSRWNRELRQKVVGNALENPTRFVCARCNIELPNDGSPCPQCLSSIRAPTL